MSYKDYSNTGIFDRNTTMQLTKEKNAELKAMYTSFYNNMRQKAKESDAILYGYNGVQLLTCFDSYINAEKKIMVYGREAHTENGRLLSKNATYQKDAYYGYDFSIAHMGDPSVGIPRVCCTSTPYLKTRRIISGIDADGKGADENKVLSILNNNLNKSSLSGNYTPCNTNADGIIYSNFVYEFNGKTSESNNVIWHELNILRPTHLIFISGKGYNDHIKRDFSRAFYFCVIKDLITQLKDITKKARYEPTSKTAELGNEEIKEYLGIDKYFETEQKMKIIYAYHPSAHFSGKARDEYFKRIQEFINGK